MPKTQKHSRAVRRFVDRFIQRVTTSDEVRNHDLITALSIHDRYTSERLTEIIQQHLFHYQLEPCWETIVCKLLDGYHFRSARAVTLFIPDDTLRSKLIVMCLLRMRTVGIPIRPQPMLN